jgi:hypothetical protein
LSESPESSTLQLLSGVGERSSLSLSQFLGRDAALAGFSQTELPSVPRHDMKHSGGEEPRGTRSADGPPAAVFAADGRTCEAGRRNHESFENDA